MWVEGITSPYKLPMASSLIVTHVTFSNAYSNQQFILQGKYSLIDKPERQLYIMSRNLCSFTSIHQILPSFAGYTKSPSSLTAISLTT